MKNLSTFSKSMLMALSIAGLGSASIVSVQAATTGQDSEAMAAVQSQISLEQAIDIAQQQTSGDVISAGFDDNDASTGGKYEITLISDNTEYEIDIDADSGDVLNSKQETLDGDDTTDYSALQQATVNMNEAMQTAAQSVNGTAIEAEFDIDNGQAAYEIDVAADNQRHKVVIDSSTGDVISTRIDNDD